MRATTGKLALCIASAFLVAACAARLLQGEQNRLLLYPEWKSQKVSLEKGLMGAQSFLVAPNSLAGRSLNLGAWHGHQRMVLDREWSHLSRAEFSAKVGSPGFLAFELHRKDLPSLSFRLSHDPGLPSAVLRVDSSGRFLGLQPFSFQMPMNQWVRFQLLREGKELALREGAREIARIPAPQEPVRIGFRGSASTTVLVDDLIFEQEGMRYEQAFSGSFPWVAFGGLFLAAFVLYLGLGKIFGGEASALTAWLLPLSCGALLLFYESSLSYRHPRELALEGFPSPIETRAEALSRLEKLTVPPRSKVVLWLGGSQAWGAGASTESNATFAKVAAGIPGYFFVNGAVSGAHAKDFLEPWEILARKTPIAAVVATLGVNDTWNEELSRDLQSLWERSRRQGAPLFLVVEGSEAGLSEAVKKSLDRVRGELDKAGRQGFDLDKAIRDSGDKGFYWWDFVHLTDAGQEEAARHLVPALKKFLSTVGAQLQHKP